MKSVVLSAKHRDLECALFNPSVAVSAKHSFKDFSVLSMAEHLSFECLT